MPSLHLLKKINLNLAVVNHTGGQVEAVKS
jgi:hypothetical protein